MTPAPLRLARTRRAAAFVLLALLAVPLPASARRTFTGENPLGVPRPFMQATQDGLEMVYRREYARALDHFEALARAHPESPVGHLGRGLAYQSMMLENYDFAYDAPYVRERDQAKAVVVRTLQSTAQKAWNLFLYAAIVGLDGIHDLRKGDVLTAFNKGWDAVEAMKRARRIEARFKDPDLGVGIYNYWRSVITKQVKTLPKFGDHRAEGIAQMGAARKEGFLVWAAAGFALAFTFWEDRDLDRAIAESERLHREYPESLVNTTLLGRLYADKGDLTRAMALFEDVKRLSPQNARVWFFIGEAWLKDKAKAHDREAEEALRKYLSMRPPKEFQAGTWYRLGQIRERAKDLDGAIGAYRAALAARPKFPACESRLKGVVAQKSKVMRGGGGGGAGGAR